MARLGMRTERFEGRTTLDIDGRLRSVESCKSAYVLTKPGRRPRERRIWIDREDKTEYVVIRLDGHAVLLPVKPVYDSNGDIGMYEMLI